MPPKKPAPKKSPAKEVEPEFPDEVYAYFVATSTSYGYRSRRSRKHELRVVTDIKKVPSGKTVAVFKKASLGQAERTVTFTLNKVVK